MIKKTIILFSVVTMLLTGLFSANAAQDGKKITLKGKVLFANAESKMSIAKRDNNETVVVKEFNVNPDGTYLYEMEVTEPGMYTLSCKNAQGVNFWAEDEDIEADFRGKDPSGSKLPYNVILKGGPNNEVMNQINFITTRNNQIMMDCYNFAKGLDIKDSELKEYLTKNMNTPYRGDTKTRLRFIIELYSDRNSVISILRSLDPVDDAELISKVTSRLEAISPTYPPLVKYRKEAEEDRIKRAQVSTKQMAPDFSFPTPDGKTMVGVKDYRGKLLLVDFWASWCGPCREAIPHVKSVYDKYKNRGLEVLSVSIDKSNEAWKKALEEEKMPWQQVCAPDAGKGIMGDYKFSIIPYIILIDKDGTIISKGLNGNTIEVTIEEALKNK